MESQVVKSENRIVNLFRVEFNRLHLTASGAYPMFLAFFSGNRSCVLTYICDTVQVEGQSQESMSEAGTEKPRWSDTATGR